MLAAVYRSKGPAREVLRIEEMPLPEPRGDEVRVRVAYSGVNPSDVKSRAGLSNPAMDWPWVVPHSDGAGVVDALGPQAPPELLGRRVWLWNGQWGRPHGTASQFVTLPARQAVPLPDGVTLEQGACVGIPLLTAWHAVASCGSLLGRTVLVPGAAGAVGRYATQLARRAGARVIASVSSAVKGEAARRLGAHEVIDYRSEDLVARVRALTGGQGVDALIDVDASAHAARYGELLAFGGQAVVYGSGQPTIGVPFRPLIMNFATLRFFIVYRLPDETMRETLRGVAATLAEGSLEHLPTRGFALDDVAAAHEAVEQGSEAKVLIRL